MSNDKTTAIGFLKELDFEIEKILNDSESIIFLTEQLYKRYNDWLEDNPDISRSEGFKNLGKDIRTLYQTCKFINTDCYDIRHSITDCQTDLN